MSVIVVHESLDKRIVNMICMRELFLLHNMSSFESYMPTCIDSKKKFLAFAAKLANQSHAIERNSLLCQVL
jgi:hypothetical protein